MTKSDETGFYALIRERKKKERMKKKTMIIKKRTPINLKLCQIIHQINHCYSDFTFLLSKANAFVIHYVAAFQG